VKKGQAEFMKAVRRLFDTIEKCKDFDGTVEFHHGWKEDGIVPTPDGTHRAEISISWTDGAEK
jgi:hypothetical protein